MPIIIPVPVSLVVASRIRAMPKSATMAVPDGQQDVVRLEVAVHDPGGVRVAQRVRDLPADVGHALPG